MWHLNRVVVVAICAFSTSSASTTWCCDTAGAAAGSVVTGFRAATNGTDLAALERSPTTAKTPSTSTATSTTTTTATTSTSTVTTVTTSTSTFTTTTSTTVTTSTSTVTTSTSTTTTTTISLDPIAGGQYTQSVFWAWLYMWRKLYKDNKGFVPVLSEKSLPKALQGIEAKIVVSSGGVASGVVSEGMGYGIMVEGIQAVLGEKHALKNGLGLMKSWLGMVTGPPDVASHPFAGGNGAPGSATDVKTRPYGVSAVLGTQGAAAGGVPPWKYPIDSKSCHGQCMGSATDGDEDAVFGMIYLAEALEYPTDFVDVVMRTLIAFASADLGFPDLYRTLPDGTKVFVPKGGSQWGGLLPIGGPLNTTMEGWCYGPSYFAPGHYRLFRDFAVNHWRPGFDAYLPAHLDGTTSTLAQLTEAFNGAVIAGYNILYRSSCLSGSVANWVGVMAECSGDALSCAGVPWSTTPYVGGSGKCSSSGTKWGAYGADASRTPWRIAMDYSLYTAESHQVTIYDAQGQPDPGLVFNAKTYLNRIVNQYKEHAHCDGGATEEEKSNWTLRCFDTPQGSPFRLSYAFDLKPKHGDRPPNLICENVPEEGLSWWGPLLSYPTFTAFVAPYEILKRDESTRWLDTFASICNFTSGEVKGDICKPEYFAAGQEVISTMIMAGALRPLPSMPPSHPPPSFTAPPTEEGEQPAQDSFARTVADFEAGPIGRSALGVAPKRRPLQQAVVVGSAATVALIAFAALAAAFVRRHRALGPASGGDACSAAFYSELGAPALAGALTLAEGHGEAA